VSPGAMELLGVTLLAGRLFSETDDQRSAPVAIVDERLAHRTWPGESAVGRRLGVDPNVTGTPSTWATVVGVVRHVRHRNPVEEVREQVYFSSRQVTRNPSVYLIKTDGDAIRLAESVRELLRVLDPSLPLYDLRPVTAYVDDARALRQFTTKLAALFAMAALLLAAVGVYGFIAYSVTERHREFAVRVALGADPFDVTRLVVGDAATLTATGVAVGLTAAVIGASGVRRELYGVAPWDPIAVGLTIAILATSALIACAWPARRAIRTDPAEALRGD
jgi:putative ABC transport system permease protein